jgi:hypothetical protein
MKKLIFSISFIVLTGLTMNSCKKENISTNGSQSKTNMATSLKTQLADPSPATYADISSFFGQHHNAILDNCINTNQITSFSEISGRFNEYFAATTFNVNQSEDNTMTIIGATYGVNNLLQTISNSRIDVANNTSLSTTQIDEFNQYFDIIEDYIATNNEVEFINQLTNLEQTVISNNQLSGNLDIESEITGPIVLLSSIGVAKYSNEFWKASFLNGGMSMEDIGPAGLAPWVAADAVGGVVGVYGNILTDVISNTNSSWSTYATSFLWGAATTSVGGLSKWLGW